MSFEVYMQCFRGGQHSGTEVDAVRGVFPDFVDDSEPDYWHVRYDHTNSCYVMVTRKDDYVEGLTVLRPCDDVRLWESLYRVLQLGPWVLYFPAKKPVLVVADKSHALQLPESMRAVLGPIHEVSSGSEIAAIIRTS